MKSLKFKQLLSSFQINLELYMRPSSRYTWHVIVDRLSWRKHYDWVFSKWHLAVPLMAATLWWILRHLRRGRLAGLAMLPFGIYVFAVSVLFERGENMRFKFWLEPIWYVFFVSQVVSVCVACYHLVRWLRRKAARA